MNLTRAGIVEKASQYTYSSASNYGNDKEIIAVEFVDILKSNSFVNYEKY